MTYRYAGFLAVLLLFLSSCITVNFTKNEKTTVPENATAQIKKVLDDQAESWNKGDLPGYMQGYWNSDSLKFIGKSGLTYGWNQTLQNYQKSYPNPEAMGQLTFTVLSVETLSEESAFVIGKWHLKRTKGDLEGHFTLLFKKLNNAWKIVADHSS